jgi:putative ABC transport system permease protein
MSVRLRSMDVARVGVGSLGARPARTVLTALGIAIGIAALVAVVGISSSSRADLLAQLDKFGTNLLEVRAGQSIFGDAATLPEEAPSMIRRIGPVDDVSAVAGLSATVRRTDLISASETGGIAVDAASPSLLTTVGGTLAEGRFIDASTESLPAVVLGATSAHRLGIESLTRFADGVDRRTMVGSGRHSRSRPVAAAARQRRARGLRAAHDLWDHDGKVSSIYVRMEPKSVEAVRAVLAATTNPVAPNEVSISRPSDAIKARAAVDTGLRALLLALGGVSLLVGGIGIANVMVISVLERRHRDRRAPGDRRDPPSHPAAVPHRGGDVVDTRRDRRCRTRMRVTAIYARRQDVPLTIPCTC